MNEVTLHLTPEVIRFYQQVAQASGRNPEQVMADALFKLAGELSLEALKKSHCN